ncbi:diguanylate phosphodiesterase, partial [Mycobacterium sp. ITM-2017-0098]
MHAGGVSSHPIEDQPESPVELVQTLLSFLRRRLGLDVAVLSSFDDGMEVVEIADGGIDDRCISPGLRWVLADSYCVRVIDGRLPAVIPDAA